MKLRSKYAITLYEILEAYVNRQNPVCIVDIKNFKLWLKVPESAYPDWRELKKRVIDVAINEVNENSADAGFSVAYEGIREGKSFAKIKFTVTKTTGRQEREATLSKKARLQKRRAQALAGFADPNNPPMPSSVAIEAFRTKWPGHDPYDVINRFQDKWRVEGCTLIRSIDGAFLKFAEGMFKTRAAKGRAKAS